MEPIDDALTRSVCKSRVAWLEVGEIRKNADINLVKIGKSQIEVGTKNPKIT